MAEYTPPFTLDNRMMLQVASISEKLGHMEYYDGLSRLPVLRKQNRIRSVYSSCAIEANSLSIEQVSDVINGRRVIGPPKDIHEVKNAIDAYSDLDEFDPFNIDDLKRAHKTLTNGTAEQPGEWRNCGEGVFAGDECIFMAPPPDVVPKLMGDLFAWLNRERGSVHPLIMSCIFHYEFVFIHPFRDGNGRTARLWQTAILSSWNRIFEWIPIENYILDNQKGYYDAISECNKKGNSNAFITFMLSLIDRALGEAIDKSTQYTTNVSVRVKKLLEVMPPGIAMSLEEITDALGLKSKVTVRTNYIIPAMNAKLVRFEFPDTPRTPDQRYIRD